MCACACACACACVNMNMNMNRYICRPICINGTITIVLYENML